MDRWMHDATDMDLLRQYADGNSDAAFASLVSRHVDLVFSAALRKTRNLHANLYEKNGKIRGRKLDSIFFRAY